MNVCFSESVLQILILFGFLLFANSIWILKSEMSLNKWTKVEEENLLINYFCYLILYSGAAMGLLWELFFY